MNMTHYLLVKSASAAPALPLPQEPPLLERFFNGLAVLVLIIVIGLCLVALIVMLAALLPNITQRGKVMILRSSWRAFFIGLTNYLFLGGISLALFSTEIPFLGFIGLLIVGFLTIITFLGLPGLVALLGERLASLQSHSPSPLKQIIWGSIVIILAGLLPFAGWFLLAPILLMLSFGAAVLGWRNRKQFQNDWQTEEERTLE